MIIEQLKRQLPENPSFTLLQQFLTYAVITESLPMANFLLEEYGVDSKARLRALTGGSEDAARLSLEKGCDWWESDFIAVRVSNLTFAIERFRLLLCGRHKITSLDEDYPALKEAAKGEYLQFLQLLQTLAGDREFFQKLALIVASSRGNLEAVRFLLVQLAKTRERYAGSALWIAAWFGHLNVVQYLSGITPLPQKWPEEFGEIDGETRPFLEFWHQCELIGLPGQLVKSAFETDAIKETIMAGLVQNAEEVTRLAASLASRHPLVCERI